MRRPRSRPEVSAARSSLCVGGRSRTFTTITSPTTRAGAALVLVLPGGFQSGAGFRRFSGYSFDRFAVESGAVVTYLDGYRRNWSDIELSGPRRARRAPGEDIAFISAVIDEFTRSGQVDPKRVFVIGFSAGGWMAMRLLRDLPERIAGAAVLSGGEQAPGEPPGRRPPGRAVPVVFFHGTGDRQVPYQGGRAGVWRMRSGRAGLSTTTMVARHAARNGITTPPTIVRLPHDPTPDPTRIELTEYRQDGHAPIALYSVIGGGHVVPGPTPATRLAGRTTTRIDAVDAIGAFFHLPPQPTRIEPSVPVAREDE